LFEQDKTNNKTFLHVNSDLIFANQDNVFYYYLGYHPKINDRYKSPFRVDNNAGCRFEYYDNILWFIDNAGHQGKLYFNCIQLVQHLYNLDYKNAVDTIIKKVKLDNSVTFSSLKPIFKSEIKINIIPWTEDNYFTLNYDLPVDYLSKQPYYEVSKYWTNSKTNWNLKVNSFGNPRDKIAYYFEDTDHLKLYFPNYYIKWYSNCSSKDLFGMHRMTNYLINNVETVTICSSGKDEMILNYFGEVATLALQQEVLPGDMTGYFSIEVMNDLNSFNAIYVWLDLDETGIANSKKLVDWLIGEFPNKVIKSLFPPEELGNDIAEISELYDIKTIYNEIR
jgi:hypothetical protein